MIQHFDVASDGVLEARVHDIQRGVQSRLVFPFLFDVRLDGPVNEWYIPSIGMATTILCNTILTLDNGM